MSRRNQLPISLLLLLLLSSVSAEPTNHWPRCHCVANRLPKSLLLLLLHSTVRETITSRSVLRLPIRGLFSRLSISPSVCPSVAAKPLTRSGHAIKRRRRRRKRGKVIGFDGNGGRVTDGRKTRPLHCGKGGKRSPS